MWYFDNWIMSVVPLVEEHLLLGFEIILMGG